MAAIELTAKEIYSRVLQAVPGVSENYVLNLLNQGLVEIGQFQSNTENAKTHLIDNKLWYDINDDQYITINKIFRCSVKNSDGEYIMIPRLTPGQIKQFYDETSVSDIFVWTEV